MTDERFEAAPAPPRPTGSQSAAAAQPSRRRRRGLVLAVGFAVVLVAGIVAWPWRDTLFPRPAVDVLPAASSDPRLAFPTRYRNVRPGVAYVGDERCAECHWKETQAYRRHPMGQSAGPVKVPAGQGGDEAIPAQFDAQGLHYEVQRRGERLFHEESKRDAQGKVIYVRKAEVREILGSGRRGRSYLIEEAGRLCQSPISWYSQAKRWDLAPGYTEHNQHFERPIPAGCLYCHTNQVAAVAGTLNRYEVPIFRGHAIGCERCHGPGELHVRRREQHERGPVPDDTIVNPKRLEPSLRDSVCEQCHLQAEVRVVRRDRDLFEYRPGLPLYLFQAFFVKAPEFARGAKAVSQVEQMVVSRCFKASGGKLSCISCHDPHALPSAGERVAFYRSRCLSCHGAEDKACALPLAARRQRSQEDDCASCHMPRFHGTDIAHTSITDHRVLRRPEADPGQAKPARPLRRGESPLVNFHAALLTGLEHEADRDLGIALASLGLDEHVPLLAARALSLLKPALERWPDDLAALEARGKAYLQLRRFDEALADFRKMLARDPSDEKGLVEAATAAQELRQYDASLQLWQRARAVNPYPSEYAYAAGYQWSRQKAWKEAATAAQEAVRLNPASLDARKLLILSLVRVGDRARARAEFEAYRAFQPADINGVRSWLDE
jgi:tetratricopeptide (TPR) repeat protein